MTEPFDLTKLAQVPRIQLTLDALRNQSPRHDPRSGEGARIHGGRFNPPESFPTLYLCETRDCVVAELKRQGKRNVVGVEGLLPRSVYRYELKLDRVIDLTDPGSLNQIGLTTADLIRDDWTRCQQMGAAAYASGDQAIRSPSATGVGNIIAVFVEHTGVSLVDVKLEEEWSTVGDL